MNLEISYLQEFPLDSYPWYLEKFLLGVHHLTGASVVCLRMRWRMLALGVCFLWWLFLTAAASAVLIVFLGFFSTLAVWRCRWSNKYKHDVEKFTKNQNTWLSFLFVIERVGVILVSNCQHWIHQFNNTNFVDTEEHIEHTILSFLITSNRYEEKTTNLEYL